MRTATFGIERGVWMAPWRGKNGETILVAIRRDGCLAEFRKLAAGDDHLGAVDELWVVLDRDDPAPLLQVI